jgi:glycosyltransferase involved in cell wall biosynthesis
VKIAVIEFAGKGGMAHYVFQLCRGLAASGADVTLITTKDYELAALPHPFRLEQRIDLWDPKPAGRLSMTPWAVAWRKLRRVGRALRYYNEWLRLIRFVASLQPDVVQLGDIRFPSDLFPLMLLRRKARILTDVCHNVRPYATGGKNVGKFDRSNFRRIFYRRIYHLFDYVFVHFERNRREFRETFGVSDERIGVIVHGNEEIFDELADPKVDAAALRARHGIAPGEQVVLFFGTLSKYKGTDVLIDAFPEIHRATGARLVLAGFPFHGFEVPTQKDPNVIWVPEYIASEEVAAWMRMAAVVVFPYRDIYQSGALHVAQTFGVPIVASAVGAMQDVIEHEVSGLLVPPENPSALAAAIVRLLQDRELAQRLGTNAAKDAQGRFGWPTIAGIILGKVQR